MSYSEDGSQCGLTAEHLKLNVIKDPGLIPRPGQTLQQVTVNLLSLMK